MWIYIFYIDIYLISYVYIYHRSPFISHLKITQSSTQTKLKRFCCIKFVIVPVQASAYTAQKIKFPIKDFFIKSDKIEKC